ncbi:type 4a pilus biogenesis protein PilO [Candidatus Parcubacteria bacterium]|nr:type 4a pilus biogenesis protein PilO [Patescibacteria group bacterium]MBU4309070.1 type 4a pilus biogenesis protein PilO [Patescibacteria group bacterium]MBU4432447.1 type 4a pilus biogenesis protein PilO [Patescibacteria group bacterium]MBU4577431.1 type 4a pilus biogenesis protein PilO [Patescibacteria group bacterium]MCG2697119.1 type 4a pilus biogenesis protein PilO [Candidatus Parcubacteria bacterium]
MNLNNQKHYSAKQKITNIIFLFIVFFGALLYFAIIPSIAAINDLEVKIINEKINSEKKYQIENNAISLNKKIGEIEPSVKTLEEVFINKNRELEFITVLESVANKNNVEQKISLTSPASEDKTVKATKNNSANKESGNNNLFVPMTITLSGNYKNVVNYLSELQSLKYYINIDGLDFVSGSSNGSLPNDNSSRNQIITLNIVAKTYWK